MAAPATTQKFKDPADYRKQMADNLQKLWEAAVTGTDNPLSDAFADVYKAKVDSLIKIRIAKKNGVELTVDEKKSVAEDAKEWARTKGFEDLKNNLLPNDDSSNPLGNAKEAYELWNASKGSLMNMAIMWAIKSKDKIMSYVESVRTGESYGSISARKEFESAAAKYATEKKFSPNLFLAELRSPSGEAVAVAKTDPAQPEKPKLTPEQQAAADKDAAKKLADAKAAAEKAEAELLVEKVRKEVRLQAITEKAAADERKKQGLGPNGKLLVVSQATDVGHDNKSPLGGPNGLSAGATARV